MGDGRAKETVRERFLAFHKANPHVYRRLVEMARQAKSAGVEKTSIWLLGNVLRWDHMVDTDRNGEPFKLSNDFLAYYARLIMHWEKDLVGFFDIKPLRRK